LVLLLPRRLSRPSGSRRRWNEFRRQAKAANCLSPDRTSSTLPSLTTSLESFLNAAQNFDRSKPARQPVTLQNIT